MPPQNTMPQAAMSQPPSPPPPPQFQTMMPAPAPAPRRSGGIWYLLIAIIIAAAAIAGSFFYVEMARGNADYICTYIIEDEGACTGGSWSDWSVATTDTAQCVTTTIERRIYTGTRTIRHILQYLNLRTACDAGYTQTSAGKGGGDSGFHGGTIVSQSTACQIEETRTIRAPAAGPGCSGSSSFATTTDLTSAQTDVGDLQSQQSAVAAQQELTAFRESMIAAQITAVPLIVRSGDATLVSWQGREVTECTVTSPGGGTGGEVWEGTSGDRTSAPLSEETMFTLSCIAFNGTTVTDSVTVSIAPVFEEE